MTSSERIQILSEKFRAINSMRDSVTQCLRNIPERLQPLVETMRRKERDLKEMCIAQDNKNMRVDITEEGATQLQDTLNEDVPVMRLAERQRCKEKARPLLSLHHPDRGGDPVTFDLIRKAAQAGDLEFIHMCLFKDGYLTDDKELDDLEQRMEARESQMRGSKSFSLARMYFSRSSEFEGRLEKLLNDRVHSLNHETFVLCQTLFNRNST